MSDEFLSPDRPPEPACRSSIFEKTTPELRHKLDKAILNYEPAGKGRIAAEFERGARTGVCTRGIERGYFSTVGFFLRPFCAFTTSSWCAWSSSLPYCSR